MKRARLVALLVAGGCTQGDPCVQVPADSAWADIARAVGVKPAPSMAAGFVNLCAAGTSPQSIEPGDGGTCAATPDDGACILCLKSSCCTEVQACDAACFAAAGGAGGGAYAAAVACGTNHCAALCGAP